MSASAAWRRFTARVAAGVRGSTGFLRGEEGFTLPEVLITIVITSVVVLCLSSAFVVGAKTSVQANSRLRESHDAQMLANYFPADAASATAVSTSTAPSLPSVPASTCPVPGTPVILFSWTELGVRRDAFYGRPAGTSELVRQFCESNVAKSRVTVARTLAAGAAATTVECPGAAGCTGAPSRVKLTLQHSSGLYSYSIQGSPRATTAS